ncbi:hypothetical protein B0H13DRAFT_2268426, partial [Mycena leptocephala]
MANNRRTTGPTVSKRGPSRSKRTQDENQSTSSKDPSDALAALDKRIAGHIDPYSDEMEAKYNIEGNQTQALVSLQQSHNLADRKILELQAEIDTLTARASFGADRTNCDAATRADTGLQEPDQLSEELAKAKAANAALRKQVQTLSQKQGTTSSDDRDSDVPVPRPAGSLLQRNMRDLT